MKKIYLMKALVRTIRVFTVSFVDEQMKQMFSFRITVSIISVSQTAAILLININISEQ